MFGQLLESRYTFEADKFNHVDVFFVKKTVESYKLKMYYTPPVFSIVHL